MSDIIKLLSDNIANQIAAGEVIQRPASAVKELLENAIDAGSTKIELIIKDAGRTLIQVIDNGCGMTETDARMSFERHATSKIRQADDLFNIRTKGFRGEALASIAAIAQVELKSKQVDAQLGTKIQIEGSSIIAQEPVQCTNGSSFSIKNLFFNVPARRNFLKSNPIEIRHIIDEVERVALAHPDVHFVYYSNGDEVMNLSPGSLKNRILGIFGKKYNERLVPVEENTPIVNIKGYVIKPEHCKKTRGEQFFFVNNRFIRNQYLHHAVTNAFNELLAKDQFASYFLFLDIDPSKIDINIHPTKTEVKFEDEKSMYAIINSAVRNSLGKFNITPSLDFEQESAFNTPYLSKDRPVVPPTIKVNPDYNPFRTNTPANNYDFGGNKTRIQHSNEQIEANLDFLDDVQQQSQAIQKSANFAEHSEMEQSSMNTSRKSAYESSKTFQLHSKYILTQVGNGLLMIDQQRAHRQILFEKFLASSANQTAAVQKLLFPQTIELDNSSYALMLELLPIIQEMGFEIENFGKNTLAVNGLPAGIEENNAEALVEQFLEQCKNYSSIQTDKQHEAIAWNMAIGSSIKKGRKLSADEMGLLIDELFACQSPNYDYKGNAIVIRMDEAELDERFNR
jgi:DNA mismatch repair protein MutL